MPHRSLSASRAAAASALPPPSPAANGMNLPTVTRAPGGRRRGSRSRREPVGRRGHDVALLIEWRHAAWRRAGPSAPRTDRRVDSAVTTSCSEIGSTTVSRSWKPSARRASTRRNTLIFACARRVTTAALTARRPHPLGERGEPIEAELLGARVRLTPALGEHLVGLVARRAPAGAARCAWSCGVRRTPRRRRARGRARRPSTGGVSRRSSRTTTESTLGRGQNTAPGTRRITDADAPVGHAQARRAEVLVAGRGDEPLPDLALHHHDPAIDRGHLGERVEHERHGDVVRKVRAERPRAGLAERRRPSRAASRRRAARAPTRRPAVTSSSAGTSPGRPPRRAPSRRRRQRDGERSEAGADLDHAIAGADARVGHDRSGEVRVDQEVLAERLRRADAVASGKVADRRRPERRRPADLTRRC